MKKWTIGIVLVISSPGCMHAPGGEQNKSETRSTPSLRSNFRIDFGGVVDLGLPYQKVHEGVAREFYQPGPETPFDSMTKKVQRVFEGGGNLMKDVDTSHLLGALQFFVSNATNWLKSACINFDSEGNWDRVVLQGPGSESPNCLVTKPDFGDDISLAEFEALLKRSDIRFQIPENLVASKEEDQTFYLKAVKPGRGTRVRLRKLLLATPDGVPLAEIHRDWEFVAYANFLVPIRSYSVSKVTAVPVVRVHQEREFELYDYGMIYLKWLEGRKEKHLVSRVSDEEMATLKKSDSNSHADLGFNGWRRKRLGYDEGEFVKYQDFLAKFKPAHPKMERLPIGSIHFMVNTLWGNGGSFDLHSAYLIPDVSIEDLRKFYLGGSIFINTMDSNTLEKNMGEATLTGEILDEDFEQRCKYVDGNHATHGIIKGGLFETEIILSREAKKAFVKNRWSEIAKKNCSSPGRGGIQTIFGQH